jgi:hypothetical protein
MLPSRLLSHPAKHNPVEAKIQLLSKAQTRKWFSDNYQDFIEYGEIMVSRIFCLFWTKYP